MVSSGSDFYRLLTVLLKRTLDGHIEWEVSTARPYRYVYRGKEGMIVLESRDQDQHMPVTFVVANSDGQVLGSFETFEVSDPEGEAWDKRVRELWNYLVGANDPIARMIDELENMPPF